MPVANNELAQITEVFAYKTIPSLVADMPPRSFYTEDFDDSIASKGQVVFSRYANTVFGNNLNDLANGWENQAASASVISATLNTLGHDHLINITDWSTIGEQQLQNIFSNVLAKQVANGVTINIMNNVTSANYTTTNTIASSSAFQFTGSNGLQGIATKLDNNEVDQDQRFFISTPNVYNALTSNGNIYNTLNYGSPDIIRNNGYKNADGTPINASRVGVRLAGFDVYKYARIGAGGNLPYGGSKSANPTVVGFAGDKSGLFAAARTPVPLNAPLAQSSTVIEPTSGLPLQFQMIFDPSKPGWRLGIYTLFGSGVGNPNAIIPLVTQSN